MLRTKTLVKALQMERAIAEPAETWEHREWRELEEAYVNTIDELKRRLYRVEIDLEVHRRSRPTPPSSLEET